MSERSNEFQKTTMAKWHYYNENNEKIGPIRGRDLKQLARQGTVMPETRVEDENGKIALAKHVTGLTFLETTQPGAEPSESSSITLPPPAVSTPISSAEDLEEQDFEQLREDFERLQKQELLKTQKSTTLPTPSPKVIPTVTNPLTATQPLTGNPFSTPTPDQMTPSVVATPVSKRNRTSHWGIISGILILAVVGVIGWSIMGIDSKPNEIVERGIKRDVLSELPLEITNLIINWTGKTSSNAAAKFSLKMKTTETLYESVTNEVGLRKLEITDLYESEFNVAMGKFRNLPVSYQSDLRGAMPQDPSRFQFYDVLVPKGGEITQTGSVELTKTGNDGWKVSRYLVDPLSCGDRFTPVSKLREGEYGLDDPKIRESVNAIIQSRRDFVSKVDTAIAGWERHRKTLIPFVQNTKFLDMWLPERNNAEENESMKNLTIGRAFDSAPRFSQQSWVVQPNSQTVTLTFTITNANRSQNRVVFSFEPDANTATENATTRIPKWSLIFDGTPRTVEWSRNFFNTMYNDLKRAGI